MNASFVSVTTNIKHVPYCTYDIAVTLAKYKVGNRYAVLAMYDEFFNTKDLDFIKRAQFASLNWENQHSGTKIIDVNGIPCQVWRGEILPPLPEDHWC